MTFTRPALALLIAFSAARSWSQCSDDFAGTSLRPAWTFIDRDSAVGGSAAVADGKLALTGRGADVFKAVNEFVGIWRSDIKGDFDVSIKIESQDNTHPYAQAGILVANDLKDLSKGGYVILDMSPGHGFKIYYDVKDTVPFLDANLGGGVTAYPAWLRLAKQGKNFTAWYKTKVGDAWKTVMPNPIQTLNTGTNSQIALISLSHNATADNKTVFDDFTCLGSTTVGVISPLRHNYVTMGSDAPVLTIDASGRAMEGRKAVRWHVEGLGRRGPPATGGTAD